MQREDRGRPTIHSTTQTGHLELMSIGQLVAAVCDIYPDVTISSVRFLEKEGLLNPQRTTGRHRIYTTSDRERLCWIKDMQRQRHSLLEIKNRLDMAKQPRPPAQILCDMYVQQLLTGDPQQAKASIIEAADAGMSTLDLYLHVLAPAMVRIGDMWAAGTTTIAQEHIATAMTRDVMAVLRSRHVRPRPTGWTAVAAAMSGDYHDLGLKMVADLFEDAGWAVTFLGANTPLESLLDVIRTRTPHIVLLSAATSDHLKGVHTAIRQIRQAFGPVTPVIGVGGCVFGVHPEYRDDLADADFCGCDALDALHQATRHVQAR